MTDQASEVMPVDKHFVQLRDAHGNAVEESGVAVEIDLSWLNREGSSGGQQPTLELSVAALQRTDEQGRVFFGDIYIAESAVQSSLEAGKSSSDMQELELVVTATTEDR